MHILWVKTELLHPIDKGGRIRTYQMLRCLLRHHHVTYLCLDDGHSPPEAHKQAREYCTELITVPFRPAAKNTAAYALDLVRSLFSDLPYAVSRYGSDMQRRRVAELAADTDLLVCDFLAPSQNVPDNLKAIKVLFQHNVEAMIWQRRATVARMPIYRTYLQSQWRRMRRVEGTECRRFDHVIAVSEADATMIRTDYQVPTVSSVPTGVDIDYFSPRPLRTDDRPELLFVGSMDWHPNEDGIRWFTQYVFQLVRAQVSDAVLTIVGRSPSKAILKLANSTSGIQVTGTVADVRPYLNRSAISIVPLRIGGGTRIKIYEAMAAGVPLVSTSIGAEGLPVLPGQHLLLGDDPQSFADAIVTLLRDGAYAQRLSECAQRFVRDHCSWEAVTAQFVAQCQKSHSPERPLRSAVA